MSRPRLRAAIPAVVATLPLLAACTAVGGAADSPPAAPAGHRTVVEVALPGGAVLTEVVQGPDRVRARSWAETADGSSPGPVALLEEIRIGDDHWVRLPALVAQGILDPGWIHLDRTDPDERRWLRANPLGLIEQQALWTARPGDRHGGEEIVAVETLSPTERVLRTAGGLDLEITREVLHDPPTFGPPASAAVVPFREVERLLPRR